MKGLRTHFLEESRRISARTSATQHHFNRCPMCTIMTNQCCPIGHHRSRGQPMGRIGSHSSSFPYNQRGCPSLTPRVFAESSTRNFTRGHSYFPPEGSLLFWARTLVGATILSLTRQTVFAVGAQNAAMLSYLGRIIVEECIGKLDSQLGAFLDLIICPHLSSNAAGP